MGDSTIVVVVENIYIYVYKNGIKWLLSLNIHFIINNVFIIFTKLAIIEYEVHDTDRDVRQ